MSIICTYILCGIILKPFSRKLPTLYVGGYYMVFKRKDLRYSKRGVGQKQIISDMT